jgi:arsenite methyltransferase
MAELNFDGEVAGVQRALAECNDMVIRRRSMLEVVNASAGERILEIGCGGGFYMRDIAPIVGPTGIVDGIDISDEQASSARALCARFDWVTCRTANALELPFDDNQFDAVFGVQVLEYVPDVDRALREIHRVLRAGGRAVILATIWASLFWHSLDPQRMKRVLAVWDRHAPHPNLPAGLATRLRKCGFRPVDQFASPILNDAYDESKYSYWLARMISSFVVEGGDVQREEARDWLQEFGQLDSRKEYFFSTMPIITAATKES